MNAAEELLKDNLRLPSAPPVVIRILDIVQQKNFSFSELVAVIQSDPALVTRMLRLVNSGFYSLPKKVGSIETAVTVLGVNAVKNIALSFTIAGVFKDKPTHKFDFNHFWRRSAVSAVAADLISNAISFKSDEMFIAALLQDIGVATMFTCRPELYSKVLDEKAVSGLPVTVIESQIFGFDHQEVGSELLKQWGLPESVYIPIRHHHDLDHAPANARTMCNVIRASDRISAVYYGSSSARNIRDAQQILSSTFGLDEHHTGPLIDTVAERSRELFSQLEIESAGIKPFTQILEEANKELSRLNLSYEMLVMEYQQAKEKSERLAVELQTANQKLRDLAFRDGLTGLYNRRFFRDAMVREAARAQRSNRPLALMLFDLDHFKNINDTYGHQRGDIVLQAVSREVERTVRVSDTVARYGGEELVVLLPEMNLAMALRRAEACRSAIEKMEIQAEGIVIRVQVSVGVSVFDPARPSSLDSIIAAADQALYRSKRQGRNRVTG
jgi:diguanylate cyclase (GGDEF)-like protein